MHARARIYAALFVLAVVTHAQGSDLSSATFVDEARLFGRLDAMGRAYHRLGWSVALEGDTAVLGGPGDGTHPGLGAVHVFVRSGSDWVLQQRIISSNQDPNAPEQFGAAVALAGDTLVVGAPSFVGTRGYEGAAYVFSRAAGVWTQRQRLTAPAPAIYDFFGTSVSVSAETILVGAPENNTGRPGSAYVFVRSGTNWSLEQKLLGAEAQPGAVLGNSVSILGDTAVVGAPMATNEAGALAGAAFVFVRSGSNWSQQQRILAPDGASSDWFGAAVSLSGESVLVGAPSDDTPGGTDGGSASIFVRSVGVWSFQQRIGPPDVSSFDRFGQSVALVGDAALVGSPGHSAAGGLDNGAAFVFTRSGTVWAPAGTVAPGVGDNLLGYAVAMAGGTILLGGPGDNVGGAIDAGSAYVFEKTGSVWFEDQKLTGGDSVEGDRFGYSVSLSGNTLAVGALGDDTALGVDNGSAYVFTRVAFGWMEMAKLTAPSDSTRTFGTAVAVDGDTLAVGAPHHAGFYGAVYVYVRTGGAWSFQQQIIGPAASVMFGRSVALSGNTLVVGAHSDNLVSGDPGMARVYVRSGTTWSLQQELVALDRAANDGFGESVSIQGDTVIVGANWVDTPAGNDTGAAYVFVRSGTSWTQQQKLVSPAAAAHAWMGHGVALSGNTAIIGAPFAYGARGAAHVFVRTGSTWQYQQELTVFDANPIAQVGYSVSLTGDRAIVGAPGEGAWGAAFLFARSGGRWVLQQRFSTSDGGAYGAIGFAVASSTDFAALGNQRFSTGAGEMVGSVDIVAEGSADVGVTKTNGSSQVVAGSETSYQIVVSNAGPHAARGARVMDQPPSSLGCATTCSGTGGATCGAGLIGAGIDDLVNIPAGQSVAYVATCRVAETATGSIVNTAVVLAPPVPPDPNPSNNSAADTDVVIAGVSVRDAAVARGSADIELEVVLSQPMGAPTGVDFSTSDGTALAGIDYQTTSRRLTFAPGETSMHVAVGLIAGGSGTKFFRVNLSNPSNIAVGDGEGRGVIAEPGALGLRLVTPCRVVDTRDSGLGGPLPLRAGETTTFVLAGRCGLPANARSVTANVTVTGATAAGHLRVFPGGDDLPSTSFVNYAFGQTRANSGVIPVGAAGDLAVYVGQPTGTVHVVVDVMGYFLSYLE